MKLTDEKTTAELDEEMYKRPRTRFHPLMNVRDKNATSYKYYDTPDGQDLLKKLMYTTKCGALLGCVYGGYTALARYPPPKTRIWLYLDGIRRGFPFVLFPIVYTTTTYALTNLRQKDEVLNANIGGAAAGLAFGLWHKNGWLGVFMAVVSAIACGVKKTSVEKGIIYPRPEPPPTTKSSWALRNLDFTLTKDIPDFKPRY